MYTYILWLSQQSTVQWYILVLLGAKTGESIKINLASFLSARGEIKLAMEANQHKSQFPDMAPEEEDPKEAKKSLSDSESEANENPVGYASIVVEIRARINNHILGIYIITYSGCTFNGFFTKQPLRAEAG